MSKALAKKGCEFPTYSMLVERGKIKELITAIGDNNPIYKDSECAREKGYEDIPAPPTFMQVIDFFSGPDFEQLCSALETNPLRMLHGEQEYEYFQPVYPGEMITAKSKVIEVEVKPRKSGGINLYTIETVYSNQKGETAVIGRMKIIEMFD